MSPDANGPCKVLITRFYSYAFGGIESYLDALLPSLVECGIEPTVVTAGGVADSQRSFLDSLGIPVIEGRVLPDLGVRRSLVDRVGDKRRARRFFRRVLAEGSFDAIPLGSRTRSTPAASLGARRISSRARTLPAGTSMGPRSGRTEG